MSNGFHSAGSRPQAHGGVTAVKGRNTLTPAIPVLLTSSRNKPVLRNSLVNSNAICSCAAKYLIENSQYREMGCSADFGLCPGHPFPFTQTRERPFLQLASELVPRRGQSSGMPQPPWGPSSPQEELLTGWHTWAPRCHTGAGTWGSTLSPPCTGPRSAFQLPILHHHIPTSAHHVLNENGQDSQTTTQTQVVMKGKMTLSSE